MHCEVRDKLQHRLDEANHQFILADREARQAPARQHSTDLLVSKADEIKHGVEVALERHLTQCPACRTN